MSVTTLPDLLPSASAYTIAIYATATNFFDLLQIAGKYQHQPPLPFVSGSEFAGVVVALPTKTASRPKFAVGDKVFGAAQGGYASQVHALEASIRAVPKGWDFLSAAGLMVTAPTSYAALVTRAGVKKGDWVLIHAAAGGVGLAAVQVAKALGAVVIATAGTPRKLEVAKAFGADHVIDYGKEGWEGVVKGLSPGKKGVDVVFDPVGKVEASLKCTAWNGRVVIVGFAGGEIEKVRTNRILLKNVSLVSNILLVQFDFCSANLLSQVGLHWGMYAKEEPEMVEVVWKGLEDMIDAGRFRGTVFTDKEFVGLEKVPEALEMLGGRETWGKVVVKVPQEDSSKL